jgi:hypothetical protein
MWVSKVKEPQDDTLEEKKDLTDRLMIMVEEYLQITGEIRRQLEANIAQCRTTRWETEEKIQQL